MTPFIRFLVFFVLSASTNAFASAMVAVVGDSDTSAEFAFASDSEKVSMNFDLKAALKLDVEEYSFGTNGLPFSS
jgi:hypothetical protein